METIEKLIKENARRAGNLSGISTIQLAAASGIPFKQVQQHLQELETKSKIRFREGINSKLAFAL